MNIQKINLSDKCMRCGICSSICPADAVNMEYDIKSGFYNVDVIANNCVECGKCLAACPAENNIQTETMIGDYEDALLVHSSDDYVRKMSTSGGVINTLVRYIIASNTVDGVIMAAYDKNSPIETSAVIIDKSNIDMLAESPRDFASRYVLTPVLKNFAEMIKNMQNIAVVGTPCQINAVCNSYPNKNIFKIGITCSGGMSYAATNEYKRKQKMQNSKMLYRGNGWPGYNTLVYEESRVDAPHLGSYFERMFSSQIFKNNGCRYCQDHFAENADISFCDFWNPDEIKAENNGNSCVIIRSDAAKKYFDNMSAQGLIETVRSLSEDEIINTQKSVLAVKKSNVRSKKSYKNFIKIIKFIFSHKIYKFFGKKGYARISRMYSKICSEEE